MDPIKERAIAERARTQLGLITTRQLADLAISRHTIRRRVDAGLWIPAGAHTFRLATHDPDDRTEILAPCLDLPATASHRGSCWLHGVIDHPGVIDVTVRKGRSTDAEHRDPRLRIHTTTTLPPDDLVWIGPIPAMSVARSLFGLAALPADEVSEEVVVTAIEGAVRRGLASDRWLWWLLEQRRRRGRNGVKRFERLLAERAELGPTESWLERELLRVIDEAGLPRPVVQRRVGHRGAFVARVDMAYEPGMVILEALGYRYHATREQQNEDAARASSLQLLGYEVHQLTYDHIVQRPRWVAEVIRRALAGAGILRAA